MRRGLLTGLAVALVAANGLIHGLWTDRWSESEEMRNAVERLSRVPLTVGAWQGEDLEMDPKHQAVGEIRGYVLRRYVRRQDRTAVSLLVVCGRPGPISVHTPDVCYRGAGFNLAGPEQSRSLAYASGTAEFRVGLFKRRDGGSTPLRIMWAWNDGGGWRAPEYPRLTYGGATALYKLYLVRETRTEQEKADPSEAFMRELLPTLDQVLFADP